MFSAMLFGLGQCLVTAAVATQAVLVITGACKAARDIRNILWWEDQLRDIDAFKKVGVEN